MKKTRYLLAVILSVISISGFAQQVADTTRWWLPPSFGDCRQGIPNNNYDVFFLDLNVFYNELSSGDTITDYGQFYNCNSTVRIAGVGYVSATCDYSFRIRDAITDTVIVELRRTGRETITNVNIPGVFEYFFDSVVTINSDFFISAWLPEPYYNSNGEQIYIYTPTAYYRVEHQGGYVACNSGKAAMARFSDGHLEPYLRVCIENEGVSWTPLEEVGIERTFYCDLGVFPIFAEEDEETNGGEGENGEGSGDSNSFLPSVEVEKYTSVFPNPASESLNVVCSYKIKSYSILNTLGQEIRSENSNANTLNINLDGLESGAYFIKITTDKGSATKRFIVQ